MFNVSLLLLTVKAWFQYSEIDFKAWRQAHGPITNFQRSMSLFSHQVYSFQDNLGGSSVISTLNFYKRHLNHPLLQWRHLKSDVLSAVMFSLHKLLVLHDASFETEKSHCLFLVITLKSQNECTIDLLMFIFYEAPLRWNKIRCSGRNVFNNSNCNSAHHIIDFVFFQWSLRLHS